MKLNRSRSLTRKMKQLRWEEIQPIASETCLLIES